MKLNDDFFASVTAKQVFLTKMDKIKSKIRHKAIRMQTLVKGDLKSQRSKRSREQLSSLKDLANVGDNNMVKMNQLNSDRRKQLVKERYRPAQLKKGKILKGKLRRRNSLDGGFSFNKTRSNMRSFTRMNP
jgi:hypothetical protein